MRESLKCFGFAGSRLRVWNWASFACTGFNYDERDGSSLRTSISGSHCPLGSGGMPQSSTPGMGGGLRSARILVNSSTGNPLSCGRVSSGIVSGMDETVLGPGSSSINRDRGCSFVCTVFLMMIWVLEFDELAERNEIRVRHPKVRRLTP